ncbi:MAG: hypothetical protein Q4F06_01545 [Eubacteriales bacterium]|nr:hypothetical protein [Eubacteriales bacterium]
MFDLDNKFIYIKTSERALEGLELTPVYKMMQDAISDRIYYLVALPKEKIGNEINISDWIVL